MRLRGTKGLGPCHCCFRMAIEAAENNSEREGQALRYKIPIE
jgi:hypothetical protein